MLASIPVGYVFLIKELGVMSVESRIGSAIKRKIDAKLTNYSFVHCKSVDVTHGLPNYINTTLTEIVKRVLKEYKISPKVKHLHDELPELAQVTNDSIFRVVYTDGLVDYFKYDITTHKNGTVSKQPGRLIMPYEWEDFNIRDDLRRVCQRSILSRSNRCREFLESHNVKCIWTKDEDLIKLSSIQSNSSKPVSDSCSFASNTKFNTNFNIENEKELDRIIEEGLREVKSIDDQQLNIAMNYAKDLSKKDNVDVYRTVKFDVSLRENGWPGFYWLENLSESDSLKDYDVTNAEKNAIVRALRWRTKTMKRFKMDKPSFRNYVKELKRREYESKRKDHTESNDENSKSEKRSVKNVLLKSMKIT